MTSKITVSDRAFLYQRQTAIRNPVDAMVELITNSMDAYGRLFDRIKRLSLPAWQSHDDGDLFIEFHQPFSIVIRDRATGIPPEQIQISLLEVGNYTATYGSRGHFSSGAKNISALGDVTFRTVCDGQYSECGINFDASVWTSHKGVAETPEFRALCGIPEGNGFEATLSVRAEHVNFSALECLDIVSKHFSLRSYFSDPTFKVMARAFTTSKVMYFSKRVTYAFPSETTRLVSLDFVVPGYPNATAKFELFQSSTQLPDPKTETSLEFGVLVGSSSQIVHEVSFLNLPQLRSDNDARYIWGRLICPYILFLLSDIDENGPSTDNPFIVLDPARKGGINTDHPFIIQLFKIPSNELGFYHNRVRDEGSSDIIDPQEIGDLLKSLEGFGKKLVNTNDNLLSWRAAKNAPLIRCMNDNRSQYITGEVRNITLFTKNADGTVQPLNIKNDKEVIIVDSSNPAEPKVVDVLDTGTFEIDDQSEANLFGHVADNDHSFNIQFSNMPNPSYRYSITKNDITITLRIFLQNPYIKNFLTLNPDTKKIEGMNSASSVSAIGQVVIEALSRLIMEGGFAINKDIFSTLKDYQALQFVMRTYEKTVTSIETEVHSTINNFLVKSDGASQTIV